MTNDDQHHLQQALAAIRERYGTHAIRLGRGVEVPRIGTGFKALDKALGGGLPRGRITELAGAPTVGLATLALQIVAQAQVEGEIAVWLDLQQTFDPDYAARCGVILDQLILVRPPDFGQAAGLLVEFIAANVTILICDLYPLDFAAAAAGALSRALERLLAPLANSATALLCLVSLPPGASRSYAQQIALPHYATVRLELERERWIRRRQDIRGYRAQVSIAKNKLGATGVSVNVNILFEDALDGASGK